MIQQLKQKVTQLDRRFISAPSTAERIQAVEELGDLLFAFTDTLASEIRALMPLRFQVRSAKSEKVSRLFDPELDDRPEPAQETTLPATPAQLKMPALPDRFLAAMSNTGAMEKLKLEQEIVRSVLHYSFMPSENWLYMTPEMEEIVQNYFASRLTRDEYLKQMEDLKAFQDPVPIDLLVYEIRDFLDDRYQIVDLIDRGVAPTARGRNPLASRIQSNLQMFVEIFRHLAYIDAAISGWVDRLYGGPLHTKLAPELYKDLTFFMFESTSVHEACVKQALGQKSSKFSDPITGLQPVDRPISSTFASDPVRFAVRYASLMAAVAKPASMDDRRKEPFDWSFLVNPRVYNVSREAEGQIIFQEVLGTRIPYRRTPEDRTCFVAVRTMLNAMMLGYQPSAQGQTIAQAYEPLLPTETPADFKKLLACVGDLLLPHPDVHRAFFEELLKNLSSPDVVTEVFTRAVRTGKFDVVLRQEAFNRTKAMLDTRLKKHQLDKSEHQALVDQSATGIAAEPITEVVNRFTWEDHAYLLSVFAFPNLVQDGKIISLESFFAELKKTNKQKLIENVLKPGHYYHHQTKSFNQSTQKWEYHQERRFRPNYLFLWMQHILNFVNLHNLRLPDGKIDVARTQKYAHVATWIDPDTGTPMQGPLTVRRPEYGLPPFFFKVQTSQGKDYPVVVRNTYSLRNRRATFHDFQIFMLLDENNITELDLGGYVKDGVMLPVNEENLNRLSNQLLFKERVTLPDGSLSPLEVNKHNVSILTTMMNDDVEDEIRMAEMALQDQVRHVAEFVEAEKESLEGYSQNEQNQIIYDKLSDQDYDLPALRKMADIMQKIREVEERPEDSVMPDPQQNIPEQKPEPRTRRLSPREITRKMEIDYAQAESDEERSRIIHDAQNELMLWEERLEDEPEEKPLKIKPIIKLPIGREMLQSDEQFKTRLKNILERKSPPGFSEEEKLVWREQLSSNIK